MNHQVKVTMYSTRFCPYCLRARALLTSKGVEFEDIAVDADPARRQEMMTRARRSSVPQIWVGDDHIGGCDELYALERQGRLDGMLRAAGNTDG